MKQNPENLSSSPLKLLSNRVRRSYTGGMLIEQWQGLPNPADNEKPEEWLASVVEARNKTHIQDEGLSKIAVNGNSAETLASLIHTDSEAFLGKQHIKKHGTEMAVLTKVLDSAVRLSIQVHPTKAYSRQFFNSEFGKTEAWYIMGGREIDNEAPYVLVGFKPGVTRAMWKQYFEDQDIESMINALHKFYVKPGDVFLIEGGMPHAIGSGCFLIEIQEPTDYTMRVERKTFDGSLLPDMLVHQGVGFENMLDCFNYEGLSREETLKRCYKAHQSLPDKDGNLVSGLITYEDTSCFCMKKLQIKTGITLKDSSFKTLIILKGSGKVAYANGNIDISQGDAYFLPAALGEIYIKNSGSTPLDIIVCYPPDSND